MNRAAPQHMAREIPVRRVLIYRLGSLGDTVIALPALHLVARAFPEAERRLLSNVPVHAKAPSAAAVLEGTGLVQGYFQYPVGMRNPWRLCKLWWALRRSRPEVVVYLAAARGVTAARRDLRFFRFCGARQVIGVPLTEAMQANFYGQEPGSAQARARLQAADLEPEAERLVRNIAVLGEPALEEAANWSLHLTAEERARAAEMLSSLKAGADSTVPLAVSVGTKVQAKDWGRENWRALLERVAPLCRGRALLLVGAPEEAEASEFAAAGWRAGGGGPVVNLCGRLSPRESAAAIACAALFVGHDSGPMHLAAAVGTPVVAIFAARNIPRQWFPQGTGRAEQAHQVLYRQVECWGCGLETCIEQRKKCLTAISVEDVLAAVRRGLFGEHGENQRGDEGAT